MNGSAQDASERSIRVIFEHARLVVVEKPAGLLSVPGRGDGKQECACAQVARLYSQSRGPWVCHRLDQATSGLIVFALDPEAQRHLSMQFQRGRVDKRYIALLRGRPDREQGRVELPLRADWPNRPKQMVDPEHGKRAVTLWRVVGEAGEHTRVEFHPITGKTHQLRVHAAAPAEMGGIGCPIVGDELYDPAHPAARLMLHASMLTLTDPDTLRRVTVRSEAPF